MELADLPAVEQLHLLNTRQLSCRELLVACQERTEITEPVINAIPINDWEAAGVVAQHLDDNPVALSGAPLRGQVTWPGRSLALGRARLAGGQGTLPTGTLRGAISACPRFLRRPKRRRLSEAVYVPASEGLPRDRSCFPVLGSGGQDPADLRHGECGWLPRQSTRTGSTRSRPRQGASPGNTPPGLPGSRGPRSRRLPSD